MKKMLVPLDGSPTSETALPVALRIAKGGEYGVILLSVWEALEGPPGSDIVGEEDLSQQGVEYLRTYLRGVSERSEAAGLICAMEVRCGHPAVEILTAISDLDVAMVALSTHGRRARAGRRGSVADKVLRASTVPVLAVGPRALGNAPPVHLRRLLVPLDGSAASESSVGVALDLAGTLHAGICLLSVVPRLFDHYGPGLPKDYITDLDRRRKDDATTYLQRLQSKCPEFITETHVLIGLPQVELPAFLERSPHDLVVMASRSRYRADLWTVGGVADLMIEGPLPVVIVPPTAA
jgi:nucleotide-binding universal stress UspA family protein